MPIALTKRTALSVIRALRAENQAGILDQKRTNLIRPTLSQRKKWTRSALGLQEIGLGKLASKHLPIDVAVPCAQDRVRLANSTCSVYATGIPAASFCSLEELRGEANSNAPIISCPELVFVEMAAILPLHQLVLLGYELCGTYCSDALDPCGGPITFGAKPVTSTERIISFVKSAKSIRGKNAAYRAIRFVKNDAWSPIEALVAAFMLMPTDIFGYDLGNIALHKRTIVDKHLSLRGASTELRKPDIVFCGTNIGVNYDGVVYLDLDSITKGALEAAQDPDALYPQVLLDRTIASVRTALVNDMRYDRELSSSGMTIIPFVKEDLIERGRLDKLVEVIINALEQETGKKLNEWREACTSKALCEQRYKLLLSLFSGRYDQSIQPGRIIYSSNDSDAFRIAECIIGF